MKNKQNLHTHTTYADGKDKPEELLQEAIKKGFGGIGFSEHSYMRFSDYPYQMTVAETENYKLEIRKLKEKYHGIIDVFCGLEFEFFSELPIDNFDYLIGSVHYLAVNGGIFGFDRGLKETLKYIDTNFNGCGMAFAKKYFETLSELPSRGNFDIVGHFDLLVKNNDKGGFIDTTSKEYINYGIETIHNLKGKIPLFELNTGAIARGYRGLPYPQMEFLKEFKNCGFGAVITTDCHDKNFIDCHYNQSKELLLAAGFKTHFVLTCNGFTEQKL